MGSLERTMRRKQEQRLKKLEKSLAKKVAMYSNLPENCLTCEAVFDKKDKELAAKWRVVIKQGGVNLYCPECWES